MTVKAYPSGRAMLDWVKDALHAQETGGLSWHASAWMAKNRWETTQRSINAFLMGQAMTQSELILIGGSAGWMMPTSWLAKFKKIRIIDIDPLASIFFNMNHGKGLKNSRTSWIFERRDGLRELTLLIKESPDSFIWFDNVLGQQCFKLKDEDLVQRQLKHIKMVLKNHHWGSIHDWLSGPIDLGAPASTHPSVFKDTSNTVSFSSAEQVAHPPENILVFNNKSMDYDTGTQLLLNAVNASGQWQDHLSAEVFPSTQPCELIPWFFKPNYCHFLLASFMKPVASVS